MGCAWSKQPLGQQNAWDAMKEPSQTNTPLDTSQPRVRTPFRVLAMLIAVLGFFGIIGLAWAAFADSWRWGLAAVVVVPFVYLMAIVAIRGRAPDRLLKIVLLGTHHPSEHDT